MRFNASKIKELRQARGLSHSQLMIAMARAGIDNPPTPQLLSGWESGRHLPGANYVGSLASFFQVQVNAFFLADVPLPPAPAPTLTPTSTPVRSENRVGAGSPVVSRRQSRKRVGA